MPLENPHLDENIVCVDKFSSVNFLDVRINTRVSYNEEIHRDTKSVVY